jgi:hypothetical protein
LRARIKLADIEWLARNEVFAILATIGASSGAGGAASPISLAIMLK